MIFCGDLSIPNRICGEKLYEDIAQSGIFKDEIVVINFEGVLLENTPEDSFWKVYNDISALRLKELCKCLIFNLANNHLYDYPENIKPMLTLLEKECIPYFGLCEGSGDVKPLVLEHEGVTYAFFGHCWNLYTKTNTNRRTDDRINDCAYQDYYGSVVRYINKNPDHKVICCFHWNFDMEEYPFPAYKKLAHDLIDSGVEAVIGNHSHVPQEIETYCGKAIAYGLGNFYMADGYFFNGTLYHPESSHHMNILSCNVDGNITVYQCVTDKPDYAICVEDVKQIGVANNNASFRYNEEEYAHYFRKNRKKKTLTPVFYTYQSTVENMIKLRFLITKVKCIRFMKQQKDKIKCTGRRF